MKVDKPLNDRFIRVVFELTQKRQIKELDIYKDLKVSYQSKSNIENGHQNVSLNILIKLAQTYPDVDMNYLFHGDGPVFRSETIDMVKDTGVIYHRSADRMESALITLSEQMKRLVDYQLEQKS